MKNSKDGFLVVYFKAISYMRQPWSETRMTTWLVNVSITPELQESVTSVNTIVHSLKVVDEYEKIAFLSLTALRIGVKVWLMALNASQHYIWTELQSIVTLISQSTKHII